VVFGPRLHEEGYKGFNIIELGRMYYAIPQGEGIFDLSWLRAGGYSQAFEGESPEAVKADVDRLSTRLKLVMVKMRQAPGHHLKHLLSRATKVQTRGQKKERPDETTRSSGPQPRLVEEGREGLNIVYFDTKYFAIPQGEGAFDIERIRNGGYSRCIIGSTLEEVRKDIQQARQNRTGRKAKALFIGAVPVALGKKILSELAEHELVLLLPGSQMRKYDGFRACAFKDLRGRDMDRLSLADLSPNMLESLRNERFDLVILPHKKRMNWRDNHAETLAAQLADRLLMISADRSKRYYRGEAVHRIVYNKAYLNSMFRFVPSLAGKEVLEVGCSDGLVCDLLLSEKPASITGIDVLETVGCAYPHERITYRKMDATRMAFADNSFDLCLSIATLEHVQDPLRSLQEMKRITRPGGYIYVQAGPLYYSPFGHHMFGYFDDYPWIHIRLSKDEIIEYCRQKGIDVAVRQNLAREVHEYVAAMLNDAHINGKKLEEYRLSEFMDAPDVEVLHFSKSYEGKDLLTDDILEELSPISSEGLVTHGFEMAVRLK
jgi:SAM-dependent methyltransferase